MSVAPPLLIVPGYKGSGPEHWQTWLETQAGNATRIDGIDWDAPVLAVWAGEVRDALAAASRPVRVIAHSFGCLAAVVAAADRPDHVAELILVAPADPNRFDFTGLAPEGSQEWSLASVLPTRSLNVAGRVIASRDDPWLQYDRAEILASTWGLGIYDLGAAGHINADSGYGPWPLALELAWAPMPDVPLADPVLKRGRGSVLAAVRQLTRQQLEKPRLRKPGPGFALRGSMQKTE